MPERYGLLLVRRYFMFPGHGSQHLLQQFIVTQNDLVKSKELIVGVMSR